MKIRSLISVITFFAVIVVVWMFTQPKDPAVEKTAVVDAPVKTETPIPTPPTPATVTKVVPTTAVPAQPSAPQPAEATAPAEGPLANLDTAISEAAHLLQTKDLVTFYKEFAPPDILNYFPPGTTHEQLAQELQTAVQTSPSVGQQMQKSLDALHAIQGQTPEMIDNSNTAIYKATLSDGSSKTIVMRKADTGLWYIQEM